MVAAGTALQAAPAGTLEEATEDTQELDCERDWYYRYYRYFR